MINPLDAWKQHATASEEMDLTGAGSHQNKGYNFAQNFPSLVPGGGVTATQWVGPALSKGYQYAQELGRALSDGLGGITLGDAWNKAGVESDANIQGMLGEGVDKNEYNEWMAEHGYGPEYDFSDIEGQTAMLGLPQLFGMVKAGMSKKQIMKKVLANQLKEEAAKKIGKKVKPIITGVLTGGKAQATPGGYTAPQHHQDVSQGGGYQAPNIRSAPKGVTTSSGMHGGKHYARGGRVSYFDGGLASLWLR